MRGISLNTHTHTQACSHTRAVAETLSPPVEEVELHFKFIIFESQIGAKAEVM